MEDMIANAANMQQESTAELQQADNVKEGTWYKHINFEDAKAFIKTNIVSAARSFIAIGYYLKHIRDNELYQEDGHETIWDFAQAEYGISKSTASRYMTMNDRFSKDGNSPTVDERYRDFDKSKLQEMLSLTDEQLEQVTPEMRVQDIREMRQPKEKAYNIPYFELEGQLNIEKDFPEYLPDTMTVRPEADAPLPTGSFTIDVSDLLPTLESEESVAISQLESREEDILPAEGYSVGSLPQAKESLLYQLAQMLVEKRGQMIRAKSFGSIPSDDVITEEIRTLTRQADGEVGLKDGAGAYASAEIIEFFCGGEDLGVCTYARFATQARKAFSEWEARGEPAAETVEEKPAVIDTEFSEIDDPQDKDPTDLEIARQELERANNLLNQCLECKLDETDIDIRRMKVKVAALASLVQDFDDVENPPPKPEQPELPILRNNDQRAAFVDAYETWPLWIETKETDERYYRYDLADGTSMVVKVYHAMLFDYKAYEKPYGERFSEGWGKQEYYLLRPGKFFKDCEANRSTLIDKLKEIQKKG